METKVTRDWIQDQIDFGDPERAIKVVGRALVAIFRLQTDSERACNDTNQWNDVGFSSADAKSGSLTAKYYLKHGTLLDWQLAKWTKPARNGYARICKYHKQLNAIANGDV